MTELTVPWINRRGLALSIVLAASVAGAHESALAGAQEADEVGIERLRERSRAQISFTSGPAFVEVFLYAQDEKSETLRHEYCGGRAGTTEYHGTYQLISFSRQQWVASALVGSRRFAESRSPEMEALRFPERSDRLIAIAQYQSCNNNRLEFFRVDGRARLQAIPFLNKDGSTQPTIAIAHGVPRPEGSAEGERFEFCAYSNAVGTFCDLYNYDGVRFLQTASWLYQGANNNDSTTAEARRSLYDFLDHLRQGKYNFAAFYYAGPLAPREKAAPDRQTSDALRFLERYCKSAGTCFRPEELQFAGTNPSGELNFNVTFLPDAGQIALGGKMFRVKRVKSDFKILDLPPSSSWPR